MEYVLFFFLAVMRQVRQDRRPRKWTYKAVDNSAFRYTPTRLANYSHESHVNQFCKRTSKINVLMRLMNS